jgi:hypothetical protein
MRLEDLTIALRPRSPWEATDLGIALARRHARVVTAAWALVVTPCLLVTSALAWLLEAPWLGMLLLWWLKPAFDRVPLYILSRAVFGATPSVRETLRAQLQWGWGATFAWLTWRRLHPGRALLLCVDLLEGVKGRQRGERARVLSRSHGSNNVMLTVIGVHLETVLMWSIVLLGLMFVPIEFMDDSAQALWDTLVADPPPWAELVTNAVYAVAMTIVEPFYVAAGFGLYLNRRTQLEAWDIEVAFRRIAARLATLATALVLAFAPLPSLVPEARAQEPARAAVAAAEDDGEAESKDTKKKKPAAATLREIFSKQYRDGGAPFERAVAETYESKDLSPKEKITTWEPRTKSERRRDESGDSAFLRGLAALFGFLSEFGLWILLALLVLLVARYADTWVPWLAAALPAPAEEAIVVHDAQAVERLPDDVPAAVRAAWARGEQRAALALLYRAAVQRLADTLGAPLPNGATEAECLRHARRLGDHAYAALFGRIVRAWQGLAYADRRLDAADVEALLADWTPRAEPGA